ncbi:MAG: DUF108 domain-containing protein [Candidatus Omnitrophica bacterium]|nr:DUF108 domain-containing protein [Candidatus Omnitrophota bacterium]
MCEKNKKRISVIGCGTIGQHILGFLHGQMNRYAEIVGVCDLEREKIVHWQQRSGITVPIVGLKTAIAESDMIVEAASQSAAERLLRELIPSRKELILLSTGALIRHEEILESMKSGSLKIYVPSGAVCGIDGIGALSQGTLTSVKLITAKPPAGLKGIPYLRERYPDIDKAREERIVFEGNVADAIANFPKNINVAATLLCAAAAAHGAKAKNLVKVCMKVNPHLTQNMHRIEIEGKEANITVEIRNVPSAANPKTSALTALSVQYLLHKIFSGLKTGS